MPLAAESASIERISLATLAVVAGGGALYALAGILTPPAMALFLAIIVDSFARVLKQRVPALSGRSAMTLAMLISILVFGATVTVIAGNAGAFVQKLADYTPRLNALLAQAAALTHIDMAPTVAQLIAQLNLTKYLGEVVKSLQAVAGTGLFILIYMGFILASRRSFERKLVNLSASRAARQSATEIFLRIRDGVEQYLWVQTATGLMIAVGSWAVMAAVGLDNAVFWAFLIFVVSYIPIVGGAIGIVAPPLFALLQFPGYWQAVVLLGVLQSLQFVVGNVVLPRMQGDSLNIDPVAVLLALAFWGAIWGVPGMFLSTPLAVVVMVVCAQFSGARWIAVLLSANGEPDKLRDRKPPPREDAESPLRHAPQSRKRDLA